MYNLSVQLATPSLQDHYTNVLAFPSHCPLRRLRSSLTSPKHLSFSVHRPLRLGHTCGLCRTFWKLFVNFLAETNNHPRTLYNFVLQPMAHDDQSAHSLLHNIHERPGCFHFTLTSATFLPTFSTPLFQLIRFSKSPYHSTTASLTATLKSTTL